MEEERESSVGDEGVEESVFSVGAVSVKAVSVNTVSVKAVSVKAVKAVPVKVIEEDVAKSHCRYQMEQSRRDL